MARTDRTIERRIKRKRRHHSIRKKLRGSATRPRLVISRSLQHMGGQLVDDDRGCTLLGVSTRAPGLEDGIPEDDAKTDAARSGKKVRASYAAGRALAERALATGVSEVVFDRAGYRFHGRVKAFAEGARAGGLRF